MGNGEITEDGSSWSGLGEGGGRSSPFYPTPVAVDGARSSREWQSIRFIDCSGRFDNFPPEARISRPGQSTQLESRNAPKHGRARVDFDGRLLPLPILGSNHSPLPTTLGFPSLRLRNQTPRISSRQRFCRCSRRRR